MHLLHGTHKPVVVHRGIIHRAKGSGAFVHHHKKNALDIDKELHQAESDNAIGGLVKKLDGLRIKKPRYINI